ncbi:MAG TPA: class II glutamine amidotransferase [Actinomycetota bacterium]
MRPWALEVERLGLSGFGWGAAWVDESAARVAVYKDTGALRDDPRAQAALEGVESRRWAVHFRRPSRLSTVDMADTQPFLAEEGAWAFSHNGEFRRHNEFRTQLSGSLQGRADSEVGFRLFEQLRREGLSEEEAIEETHRRLEGHGNVVYLSADGKTVVRAANRHNPVWTFDMNGGRWAVTALHSPDESLFDMIFRDAENRVEAEVPSQIVVAEAIREPAHR